jgi:hypothetical protein
MLSHLQMAAELTLSRVLAPFVPEIKPQISETAVKQNPAFNSQTQL